MPQLLSVWSGCHGFIVHFLESVCILFHNSLHWNDLWRRSCSQKKLLAFRYNWPNIHLILHFTSDCCSSDILQNLFELFRIKQQIKFQGNALIKYEILVCLLHTWVKKYQIFFFTLKGLALYYACSFMIGTLKKMSLHAYLHRERLSVDLVFWPPGAVSTPVEADVR